MFSILILSFPVKISKHAERSTKNNFRVQVTHQWSFKRHSLNCDWSTVRPNEPRKIAAWRVQPYLPDCRLHWTFRNCWKFDVRPRKSHLSIYTWKLVWIKANCVYVINSSKRPWSHKSTVKLLSKLKRVNWNYTYTKSCSLFLIVERSIGILMIFL